MSFMPPCPSKARMVNFDRTPSEDSQSLPCLLTHGFSLTQVSCHFYPSGVRLASQVQRHCHPTKTEPHRNRRTALSLSLLVPLPLRPHLTYRSNYFMLPRGIASIVEMKGKKNLARIIFELLWFHQLQSFRELCYEFQLYGKENP